MLPHSIWHFPVFNIIVSYVLLSHIECQFLLAYAVTITVYTTFALQ